MDEFTWMPDITLLDDGARMFMFGWLEAHLDGGQSVTQEDWRAAFGAAVDDQTARAAGWVLSEVAA
jgi:hypothetical protein